MLKRIISVIGANLFGQVITIVIQIISVPLFLTFWGSSLYGEWLILSALPTYIIVSGTGIGFVAGNTMQKHIAATELTEARCVFQSAFILTICLSVCLLLIVIALLFLTPILASIKLVEISTVDARTSLIILTLYVLLTLQTELYSSVYRATGNFARSITIMNVLRLVEFIFLVISISFGAKVVVASLIFLIIRLFGIFWMLIELRTYSWFSLGVRYARKSVIRAELAPIFSFLGFPLGHACLIQGMTAVIGIRLGSNAVVMFSITRTLTGFIRQFASSIYYSIWPELSSTISTGKLKMARALHRHAFQITLLFSCVSSIFLLFFGNWFIQIWTGGKVQISNIFFLIMLASTIPNTLWMMSSYVSISVNQHSSVALVYSITAVTCMIVVYLIAPYFGLVSISVAFLTCDVFILSVVLNRSFNIIHEKAGNFLYFLISNLPFTKFVKFRNK